jgi:hypothetical protein
MQISVCRVDEKKLDEKKLNEKNAQIISGHFFMGLACLCFRLGFVSQYRDAMYPKAEGVFY